MAEKITGKIDYINEKEGKFGTMYSIKVGGTNYGVGKYAPRGVEQGDTVEFDVEYNGNWPNVARGTLRKIEGSVAPPAKAAATKAAYSKASSYEDKDKRITKLASLNTSLAFLEFALKNETLPVPKAKNAGYGYLKALWLKEAAELYELNTGEAWEIPEADVEDEAPKPAKKATKKAAKAAPVEEEEFVDDDVDDVEWE